MKTQYARDNSSVKIYGNPGHSPYPVIAEMAVVEYMVGVDHANALARPWGEIIGEVRKLYNPNGATEE